MYKVREPETLDLAKANPLEGTDLFLDPNTLAEDGTAALGSQCWSEDGRYLAYQVKRGGSDWATMYVRDSQTIQDLPDEELKWIKFSGMSWTHDNAGFFYSRFNAPQSHAAGSMEKAGTETEKLEFQKVVYHRVGTK